MKQTIKKHCEEQMAIPFRGHPSREYEQRVRTLEQLILKLAQQIDNLNNNY